MNMTRIVLVLCAAIGVSSFCLAQQPSTNETVSKAVDVERVAGKVASVYSDDPLRDFPGRIEIIDEEGQRLVFLLVENTTMSAKNGTKLNVRRINNDDKVVIEYTRDSKNRKIAQSIKVSE